MTQHSELSLCQNNTSDVSELVLLCCVSLSEGGNGLQSIVASIRRRFAFVKFLVSQKQALVISSGRLQRQLPANKYTLGFIYSGPSVVADTTLRRLA